MAHDSHLNALQGARVRVPYLPSMQSAIPISDVRYVQIIYPLSRPIVPLCIAMQLPAEKKNINGILPITSAVKTFCIELRTIRHLNPDVRQAILVIWNLMP